VAKSFRHGTAGYLTVCWTAGALPFDHSSADSVAERVFSLVFCAACYLVLLLAVVSNMLGGSGRQCFFRSC
jgi:hypothetical protein